MLILKWIKEWVSYEYLEIILRPLVNSYFKYFAVLQFSRALVFSIVMDGSIPYLFSSSPDHEVQNVLKSSWLDGVGRNRILHLRDSTKFNEGSSTGSSFTKILLSI
jgi:hypothetical protein